VYKDTVGVEGPVTAAFKLVDGVVSLTIVLDFTGTPGASGTVVVFRSAAVKAAVCGRIASKRPTRVCSLAPAGQPLMPTPAIPLAPLANCAVAFLLPGALSGVTLIDPVADESGTLPAPKKSGDTACKTAAVEPCVAGAEPGRSWYDGAVGDALSCTTVPLAVAAAPPPAPMVATSDG
jgi:hypothetical protein